MSMPWFPLVKCAIPEEDLFMWEAQLQSSTKEPCYNVIRYQIYSSQAFWGGLEWRRKRAKISIELQLRTGAQLSQLEGLVHQWEKISVGHLSSATTWPLEACIISSWVIVIVLWALMLYFSRSVDLLCQDLLLLWIKSDLRYFWLFLVLLILHLVVVFSIAISSLIIVANTQKSSY